MHAAVVPLALDPAAVGQAHPHQLIVAIQARDLPAIQAGVMIMAATYSIVNVVADLLYAYLDKRIQYD